MGCSALYLSLTNEWTASFVIKKEEPERRQIKVSYSGNENNELHNLCLKYGTDKTHSLNQFDWPSHTYSDYYSTLFEDKKNEVRKVFECGIGTSNKLIKANMGDHGEPGASLRVWKDYFPNAFIFGADIDRSVMFNENRINTYYVDQTDRDSIVKMWRDIDLSDFDVIIDDGLHEYHAGKSLFENSINFLSKNGIYIIEDASYRDIYHYKEYFLNKHDYDVQYVYLKSEETRKSMDNNLVVIRHK